MCPSGATCLSADCFFSELPLQNPTQRVGLEQSRPHHHLIENYLVLICWVGVKQQSLTLPLLYHRQDLNNTIWVTLRVSLVEQELLTLPEHLSSSPVFSGVRVTRSLVLLIVVCPFVLFLLAIVLSVLLRYTDSDCPFGICKLFLFETGMLTLRENIGWSSICWLIRFAHLVATLPVYLYCLF